MHLRLALSFWLLTSVGSSINENFILSELIVDYIEYKNASRSLSAFLCLQDFDTISLTRKLMGSSIGTMIASPNMIWYENKSVDTLLRYNYHRLNVIADLRCERSEELIIEVSTNKMFNYSYAWLFISDNESYAMDLMTGMNLSVDADVVLAIASETVILYDLYNTGSDRNGTFNATFIGTWEKSRRLDIIKLESFVYRRRNLTGITIKFAAVTAYLDPEERDPIEYLSNFANKSYDNVAKLNYALGLIPRDFFNYTVEISTWVDYGGRWNGRPFFGMMGALGRKEADFTLGGSVITKDRLEYCTPIVQNYPFWTGFLFKRPPSHSIRNVFLQPLAPMTWNAVLVVSILFILLLTLVAYYNRRDNENPWSFGIYFTLATLFQQGWSSLPRGPSGRILLIVSMVFSMLLYNFYSASVVSSLLSYPPETIRTIADLLNTGMPAAYENASYVPHYFGISTIQAEKKFYEKRLLDKGIPQVLPRPEGIRRVRSGGFAYHTTPADAYEEIARDFTQPEICGLAEVTFIRKSILAVWSSRENPYREHLKIVHRRLEEVGILAREQKRWFAPRPECLGGLITLNSIGFAEVAPAFIGLFCGATAAVFILILELAYHSLAKKGLAPYLRHRLKEIRAIKRRVGTTIVQQNI